MSQLHTLVTHCNGEPWSGVAKEAHCTCLGCLSAYYIKRVGEVKAGGEVYSDLLLLATRTDEFAQMPVNRVRHKIVTLAIPLLSTGRVFVNINRRLLEVNQA